MRILVAGINIRHIAASASRAGHEVIAADCYCDRDLSIWAKKTFLLPRQRPDKCLVPLVQGHRPDALVLGPGLEQARVPGVPVLNNPPEKSSQVSDKLWLAGWLEREGYPFIRTQASLEGMTYPFLVKPRWGAGGVGCRVIRSHSDLDWQDGLIAQELVSGRPASVSVIANGSEARAVAVNEQLIGLSWAGARGYRYSGNITPLEAPQRQIADLAAMAESIIAGLGLVGSNGVDFLLGEKGPVPVEVNSRFQGSLDSVEMACGINVFQAHLQSFSGLLPDPSGLSLCTAGRVILYAPSPLGIDADLLCRWTADVPVVGSRIEPDDPVLSITSRGAGREAVLSCLRSRAAKLGRLLKTEWG
jgi:predicted ATP-grasp superfamily ATP-dependent carboligase